MNADVRVRGGNYRRSDRVYPTEAMGGGDEDHRTML